MRLVDGERVIDGGHESLVFGRHFVRLAGAANQGISCNIGTLGNPGPDSFALALNLTVPVALPEITASLAAFSQAESLSPDGEAQTLAAWWATNGDLVVTLYGAGSAHYRRLTIAGHVQAHAGERVTLTIQRDSAAGTLTIYQDDVALTGTVTTAGTAPAWSGTIDAGWLHICGAREQAGIGHGYVGGLYAVGYYNFALSAPQIAEVVAGDGAKLEDIEAGENYITLPNAINATTNGWTSFSGGSPTGFVATNASPASSRAGWVIPADYRITGRQFRFGAVQTVNTTTMAGLNANGGGFTGTPTTLWTGQGTGRRTGTATWTGSGDRLRILASSASSLTMTDAKLDLLGCILHWACDARSLTLPDTSGNDLHGEITEDLYAQGAMVWDRDAERLFDGGWHPEPGVSEYQDPDPWRPEKIIDGGEADYRPTNWRDFELVATQIKRVTSGGTATDDVDSRGVIIRTTSGASTITDYAIDARFASVYGMSPVVWESSNPARATVDENGYVTGKTAGLVTITATANGITRDVSLLISLATGSTATEDVGFEEGSVAAAICETFLAGIAGKAATVANKNVYTTQNHAAGIYVRNPNCWAAGFDLTPISPWNSHGGTKRAGILITRQHVWWAAHYTPDEGSTIRFIGLDGAVYDRVLLKARSIPIDPVYGATDGRVGVLDSPLPEAIAHATILPDDWEDYLPVTAVTVGGIASSLMLPVPLMTVDMQERAIIQRWDGSGPSITFKNDAGSSAYFAASNFLAWNEGIESGDSSSPICTGYDGQLIALAAMKSAGGGTSIRHYYSQVVAAIAAADAAAGLSTGYLPTPANFSTFNTY